MVIDMLTDIPEELAKDPWFKVVEFLQQNWAVVIEREEDVLVVFYGDTCGVFDEMPFPTRNDAERALRRNGFSKFMDDKEVQQFIGLPRGDFTERLHPNGRIYSSGRFWVEDTRAKCKIGIQERNPSTLHILPCLDSEQMATSRWQELNIPRDVSAALGRSAVEAARAGFYFTKNRQKVDWHDVVQAACAAKLSLRPDAMLPSNEQMAFTETRVQVTNETTLGASRRLFDRGLCPLALNFANGIQPGGGFLHGARAQEEVLCRSSALYLTLVGDPMYENHRMRPLPDSTDWTIYSPDVPVFRMDDGTELPNPWFLSFITCAAPYAPRIGQPQAGDLLQKRIHRVLAIAHAYGYSTLVLGAWGCGAFANDPHRTAMDFRRALESDFNGVFSEIVFAITDWSAERRFLGPFLDVFAANNNA